MKVQPPRHVEAVHLPLQRQSGGAEQREGLVRAVC